MKYYFYKLRYLVSQIYLLSSDPVPSYGDTTLSAL